MSAIGSSRRKAPGWYWIVAVLALVWNGYGCLDFVMTVTRNPVYLAAFPPEYVAYLDTFPSWMTAAWALGVFGALAGALFLLIRSRWAVAAFLVSLAGLLATTIYQWVDTRPAGLPMNAAEIVISLVIWCVALALVLFAIAMRARGVLR